MKEDFELLREDRRERRDSRFEENMSILKSIVFPFQSRNNDEVLLFREEGMPKVDFYPGTGRWRVAGIPKTFRGGAKAFLTWYEKQSLEWR